jgi:hypothetical protein
MAGHPAGDMQECARLAGHGHEGAQVRSGLNGEAPEARLAQRFAQKADQRPQGPPVIGGRNDRASASTSAGQMAVSVGNVAARLKGQGRMGLKERHHAGRVGKEGRNKRRVEMVAKDSAQVGLCRLGAVECAGAGTDRVAGCPDPSARPGGGPAQNRGLLGDDDPKPVLGGSDRRGKPGRARSDGKEITGFSHCSWGADVSGFHLLKHAAGKQPTLPALRPC